MQLNKLEAWLLIVTDAIFSFFNVLEPDTQKNSETFSQHLSIMQPIDGNLSIKAWARSEIIKESKELVNGLEESKSKISLRLPEVYTKHLWLMPKKTLSINLMT